MQPIELGAFMLAVERKSYYISSTCVVPVGSYLCLLLAPVTSIAFWTSGAQCTMHTVHTGQGGEGEQLMQIGSHVRRKIGTRVKRISGLTWDQCWIHLKSLSEGCPVYLVPPDKFIFQKNSKWLQWVKPTWQPSAWTSARHWAAKGSHPLKNKVAAHRSFKPPKHDLGRVQSIQKWRRCAICAIECQKKHENVSRSSNAVRLILHTGSFL